MQKIIIQQVRNEAGPRKTVSWILFAEDDETGHNIQVMGCRTAQSALRHYNEAVDKWNFNHPQVKPPTKNREEE